MSKTPRQSLKYGDYFELLLICISGWLLLSASFTQCKCISTIAFITLWKYQFNILFQCWYLTQTVWFVELYATPSIKIGNLSTTLI